MRFSLIFKYIFFKQNGRQKNWFRKNLVLALLHQPIKFVHFHIGSVKHNIGITMNVEYYAIQNCKQVKKSNCGQMMEIA